MWWQDEKVMNKLLYKIELYLVKVIPMIYALLSLLNTTLSYFNIDAIILSYIGSVSFITLLFLYITSYVFKFCEYHRMFIHYTTITWILNIIDLYIGIPVSDIGYLGIQLIVAGISLFIILYLYVKSHKKSIITEGEALEIVDSLKRFTDKEKRLSKYAACEYLNVSRATFDNYVREGKLPRGKHEIGFKELSWSKKELDEFVKKCRNSTLLHSKEHSLT